MHTQNSAIKKKAFDFEVKAVNDDGRFSGYGSVFGTVDSYDEVVAPGAFLESLAEMKKKGRTFPVLWQHRTMEPIGHWDINSLKEDEYGLFGEGTLWLNDASYARTAWQGIKNLAITGLSIGYHVRESTFDGETRIRTLTKLDLMEISIVTTPANDAARIDVIKSKLMAGNLPSLSEFERFLLEAGFSKTQSVAIANHGLGILLDPRESGGIDSETKHRILAMCQVLDQCVLPKLSI